jgi:hypothetical protein
VVERRQVGGPLDDDYDLGGRQPSALMLEGWRELPCRRSEGPFVPTAIVHGQGVVTIGVEVGSACVSIHNKTSVPIVASRAALAARGGQ